MIVSLLAGLLFQSTGYYAVLLWFSLSIAFFLVSKTVLHHFYHELIARIYMPHVVVLNPPFPWPTIFLRKLYQVLGHYCQNCMQFLTDALS